MAYHEVRVRVENGGESEGEDEGAGAGARRLQPHMTEAYPITRLGSDLGLG